MPKSIHCGCHGTENQISTFTAWLLNDRLHELESEYQSLQKPAPEPSAAESSSDEQISSMSESSADSSDRAPCPMNTSPSMHSSMDEEESGPLPNGHLDELMQECKDSDATSDSGDSADSSITTASVAVEPLLGYTELVEEVRLVF